MAITKENMDHWKEINLAAVPILSKWIEDNLSMSEITEAFPTTKDKKTETLLSDYCIMRDALVEIMMTDKESDINSPTAQKMRKIAEAAIADMEG